MAEFGELPGSALVSRAEGLRRWVRVAILRSLGPVFSGELLGRSEGVNKCWIHPLTFRCSASILMGWRGNAAEYRVD